MKIQLSAAKSFEMEPGKKYLLLISPKIELTKVEKHEIVDKLGVALPNVTVMILPPGTKYKTVEQKDATS